MHQFIFTQLICPQCLRCGSLQVQEYFYCKVCIENILSEYYLSDFRWIDVLDKRYKIESALTWNPNQSNSLSELAYLLKSRFSKYAWQWYVKNLMDISNQKPDIIVPAPGSKKISYHTHYFAEQLTMRTGAKVIRCLRKRKNIAQKNIKRRSQNTHLDIRFDVDFTRQIAEAKEIWLVDDIVTTGQTITSSLLALLPYTQPDVCIRIIALLSREKI